MTIMAKQLTIYDRLEAVAAAEADSEDQEALADERPVKARLCSCGYPLTPKGYCGGCKRKLGE